MEPTVLQSEVRKSMRDLSCDKALIEFINSISISDEILIELMKNSGDEGVAALPLIRGRIIIIILGRIINNLSYI